MSYSGQEGGGKRDCFEYVETQNELFLLRVVTRHGHDLGMISAGPYSSRVFRQLQYNRLHSIQAEIAFVNQVRTRARLTLRFR